MAPVEVSAWNATGKILPASDVGKSTVIRGPDDDTSAKVLLLLRIVSVGFRRYGLKLMTVLELAVTVIMFGTATAELDAVGAEVMLAATTDEELGPVMTRNTSSTV